MMNDLEEYIRLHSSPEPQYLTDITRDTHLNVLNAHMLSGHIQGRVLSMFSHMLRPKRILELGTFTAYSALCLAEGLQSDGELITIDRNDELEEVVVRNLERSPLGARIKPLIGDAKQLLREMGESQETFDLIFIDADKREYCEYLDLCLPLLRPNGLILADNTLWDGHIIDPAYDKDKQTLGLRAFNDRVASDAALDAVILPLRDGLTMIRPRNLTVDDKRDQ